MLVRLLGYAAALVCWLTAMIRFHAQSWEPRTTIAGAFAGWSLVLAGTILFFLCTLGIPARFIPRWLAYFGRISYGLYMFHSLVFYLVFEKIGRRLVNQFPELQFPAQLTDLRNAIGAAVVLLLSIMLAHLSYRYFERPFLRLKERFTFVIGREDA